MTRRRRRNPSSTGNTQPSHNPPPPHPNDINSTISALISRSGRNLNTRHPPPQVLSQFFSGLPPTHQQSLLRLQTPRLLHEILLEIYRMTSSSCTCSVCGKRRQLQRTKVEKMWNEFCDMLALHHNDRCSSCVQRSITISKFGVCSPQKLNDQLRSKEALPPPINTEPHTRFQDGGGGDIDPQDDADSLPELVSDEEYIDEKSPEYTHKSVHLESDSPYEDDIADTPPDTHKTVHLESDSPIDPPYDDEEDDEDDYQTDDSDYSMYDNPSSHPLHEFSQYLTLNPSTQILSLHENWLKSAGADEVIRVLHKCSSLRDGWEDILSSNDANSVGDETNLKRRRARVTDDETDSAQSDNESQASDDECNAPESCHPDGEDECSDSEHINSMQSDHSDNNKMRRKSLRLFKKSAAKLFYERIVMAFREKVAKQMQKELIEEENAEKRTKQKREKSKNNKKKDQKTKKGAQNKKNEKDTNSPSVDEKKKQEAMERQKKLDEEQQKKIEEERKRIEEEMLEEIARQHREQQQKMELERARQLEAEAALNKQKREMEQKQRARKEKKKKRKDKKNKGSENASPQPAPSPSKPAIRETPSKSKATPSKQNQAPLQKPPHMIHNQMHDAKPQPQHMPQQPYILPQNAISAHNPPRQMTHKTNASHPNNVQMEQRNVPTDINHQHHHFPNSGNFSGMSGGEWQSPPFNSGNNFEGYTGAGPSFMSQFSSFDSSQNALSSFGPLSSSNHSVDRKDGFSSPFSGQDFFEMPKQHSVPNGMMPSRMTPQNSSGFGMGYENNQTSPFGHFMNGESTNQSPFGHHLGKVNDPHPTNQSPFGHHLGGENFGPSHSPFGGNGVNESSQSSPFGQPLGMNGSENSRNYFQFPFSGQSEQQKNSVGAGFSSQGTLKSSTNHYVPWTSSGSSSFGNSKDLWSNTDNTSSQFGGGGDPLSQFRFS